MYSGFYSFASGNDSVRAQRVCSTGSVGFYLALVSSVCCVLFVDEDGRGRNEEKQH